MPGLCACWVRTNGATYTLSLWPDYFSFKSHQADVWMGRVALQMRRLPFSRGPSAELGICLNCLVQTLTENRSTCMRAAQRSPSQRLSGSSNSVCALISTGHGLQHVHHLHGGHQLYVNGLLRGQKFRQGLCFRVSTVTAV